MKKSIFLLLFFSTFLSCNSDDDNQNTNSGITQKLQKIVTKDPSGMLISEQTFSYSGDNLTVTETQFPNSNYRVEYEYTENALNSYKSFSGSELIGLTSLTYFGNLIYTKSYEAYDIPDNSYNTSYTYNNKEQVMEEQITQNENQTGSVTHIYDNKGNSTQSTNSSNEAIINEYDNKKNPLASIYTKAYQKIILTNPNNLIKWQYEGYVGTNEYIYNANNYPISVIQRGNGQIVSTGEFYYN